MQNIHTLKSLKFKAWFLQWWTSTVHTKLTQYIKPALKQNTHQTIYLSNKEDVLMNPKFPM